MQGIVFIPLFVVFSFALQAHTTDSSFEQYAQKAILFEKEGNYKQAMHYYDSAYSAALYANDVRKQTEILQQKGVSFSKMSVSDSALVYLFKALALAEKQKLTAHQARLNKNIGAVYVEQKDYTTAINYYNNAKKLAENTNDTLLTADLLNNMGLVVEVQGNPQLGLSYYLQAYQLYKKVKNDNRIALAANNIAIVYKNVKDYKRAEKYLREAIAITEKSGDTWMIAANYVNFSNVLFGNGKLKEARRYTEKAIALAAKIPAWEITSAAYHNLSDYAEKTGDYSTALAMYKRKVQESDSLINTQRLQQIAEIREKYAAEKREDTIRLLAQEKEIQQLKIQQQNMAMAQQNGWWASGVLAFLLIIGGAFLAYNHKKEKEKAYYQANLMRVEAEKQIAIFEAERSERMRIARDMHDELGSGLSKIAILTEQVYTKTAGIGDIKTDIENIAKTARHLVGNMSDLVWALNVGDTQLDFLIARMREFVFDFLEECNLPFSADFPENVPAVYVSKEVQRNVFLCFKETINNAVKHAKASHLYISVGYQNHLLSIKITDNGVGFNVDTIISRGNGLKNLQKRMENIQGEYTLHSQPGSGTQTNFSVKLQ